MKRFSLILLLLLSFQSKANLNLDSLWNIYEDESKADTTRLLAMWFICYDVYLFRNPDSSVMYSLQMYDFAKGRNQYNYQAHALATASSAYYFLGELDSALSYNAKALLIHQSLNNYPGAATVFNNNANIYREQGHLDLAIDNFMKALRIYERIDAKSQTCIIMANVGASYSDLGEFKTGYGWYQRSLAIAKEIDQEHTIALVMTGLGSSQLKWGNMDSAMYYQRESMKLRLKAGNLNGIAFSNSHIGEIFLKKGELDSALFYFETALEQMENLKLASGITDVCQFLSDIHMLKGNKDKARSYGLRSLEIALDGGYVDSQRDAYQVLYEIYKGQGEKGNALDMFENYIMMRDSINRMDNQKAVLRQEYEYQYDKKSLADSLRLAEKQRVADVQHEKETEKQRIIIWAVVGGLLLISGFLFIVFQRFRITKKQKLFIEEQKEVVEQAHHELEIKNEEILDSINYAKRIQKAILPPDKLFESHLPDAFVLYKPKDIVAGDFYWLEHIKGTTFFAAADCTGHGVPGAMVSVVCNNGLNRSVREYGLKEPDAILNKTREMVIREFEKSEDEVKDGMDIALCALHVFSPTQSVLKYAGANNPLWIIRKGGAEVEEIKPDKQPIGKFREASAFTKHRVELNKGDCIYIFSDGYADQFGGDKGKKFKTANFKTLLLSIQNESMSRQKEILDENFESWKGSLEQLDDVCVIGVKI